jgi:hypothetical protein
MTRGAGAQPVAADGPRAVAIGRSADDGAEVERAVLGAALINEKCAGELAGLGEGLFARPDHRAIARAIKATLEAGEPVDLLTLHARLAQGVDNAGGLGYLAGLDNLLPDVGRFPVYVSILQRAAAQRAALATLPEIERELAAGRDPDTAFAALYRSIEEMRRASGRRLHLLDVDDLLGLEIPEREFLLEPVLRQRDLAMLYGWRGRGKTRFAMALAVAVASGAPALATWRAPKPRGVLYVDGELPASTLRGMVADLVAAERHLRPVRLSFLCADLEDGGIPDLATPAGQALVEEHLDGVELLVLDNKSCLFRSGVENEAESWTGGQEWLLRLRRRGVGVLLVQHAGKAGTQRGTSRVEDVLDLVIALKEPPGYTAAEGARFEVHVEKARGLHGAAVEPFEAKLETDDRGRAAWVTTSLEGQTYRHVVARAQEGLSPREIAASLGRHKSSVSRHLAKARREGLIQ